MRARSKKKFRFPLFVKPGDTSVRLLGHESPREDGLRERPCGSRPGSWRLNLLAENCN